MAHVRAPGPSFEDVGGLGVRLLTEGSLDDGDRACGDSNVESKNAQSGFRVAPALAASLAANRARTVTTALQTICYTGRRETFADECCCTGEIVPR